MITRAIKPGHRTIRLTEKGERSWRAFRSRSLRNRSELLPDGLYAHGGPSHLSHLWIGSETPKRILYFTKNAVFRWWFSLFQGEIDAPQDVAIFSHGSLPSTRVCRFLKATANELRLPLLFFGDLDPGDLIAFAALIRGDPDLRRRKNREVPVKYLGVTDLVLDIVFGRSATLQREATLPMAETELRHFQLIETLLPELEALIGSRSLSLLRSGKKLEVEAMLPAALREKKLGEELKRFFLTAGPNMSRRSGILAVNMRKQLLSRRVRKSATTRN